MQFKLYLLTLGLIASFTYSYAQPINDKCSEAISIPILNKGFGLGVFSSSEVSMDSATRDIGETCDESIKKLGTCDKTVWYSFYIPTTRNVEVTLKQADSVIPQIFAGFTIYEAPNCDMTIGDISSQLVPLGKFGASGNSCLQQGRYYIQVSAKNRTKGEIWLDLKISKIAAPIYDEIGTPFYILPIINKRVNKSLDVQCTSVEEFEADAIKDSAFCKSIWLSIKLNKNTFNNSIRIGFYQDKVKYRLFRNKPTKDSILSKTPFMAGDKIYVYEKLCPSQTKDSFLYIQVIMTKDISQIGTTIFSMNHQYDDWSSPLTTSLNLVLKDRRGGNFTRHFSCEGNLKYNPCKPLVPDTIIRPVGNTSYNYLYAGYGILDCQEDGSFSLNVSAFTRHDLVFLIYEGDMRKSCNLKLVEKIFNQRNMQACLKKGIYTLVIASNVRTYLSTSSEIKFTFSFQKTSKIVEHFAINNPENMNVYDVNNPASLRSQVLHFHSEDRTIQIDTFKRTGRFIFREGFFKHDSKAEINNDWNQSTFIFRGRHQTGDLAFIPNFNYSTGYIARNQCDFFKSGYYTIISLFDTGGSSKYIPCIPPRSQISISKEYVCVGLDANTEPGNAMLLNNGKDLASNPTNKKDLSYVYSLKQCYDCKLHTLKQPVLSCRQSIVPSQSVNRLFYFYTFFIKNNCQVDAPYSGVLYKGNARLNSNLCLDSLKIIDPCGQGNIYCNLKGGEFYTLVYYRRSSNSRLVVTPHITSPNDFLASAYDFGKLNMNLEVQAPSMPITCHTFALTNDPSQSRQSFNKEPIPFPDTLNKSRLRKHKNIWYTFTVDGGCKIGVTSENYSAYLATYKYIGPFDESYKSLLQNGFDTSSGLFQRIYSQNSSYLDITNKGCSKNRYFVAASTRYTGSIYTERAHTIKVKITPLNGNHDLGDHCSNAVTKTISSISNNQVNSDNYCHTYGGSPYEEEIGQNLKSTWFKVSIRNLKKIDLEFKYATTNVRLQKYILYAGSCDALTKVAEVQNQFNYFTLSCMGVGDYYIQAITSENVSGVMGFSVNAKTPQSLNCKPYDFNQPIAQFEINGGCNSDTLRLKNLSTQGDSIKHKWYVNNRYVSKDLNPLISIRKNGFLVGKNKIKLVVENIGYKGLKDSVVFDYFNDTTQFYAKIIYPSIFSCRDTVHLYVETNYPHKANYSWASTFGWFSRLQPYAKEQTLFNVSQLGVYVVVSSDNCIFTDTVNLVANKSLGIFVDTSLCAGEGEIKYENLKDFSWIYLNDELITDSTLTINKSGTYRLYYYTQGCSYRDTIKLHFANKRDTFYSDSTVSLCNQMAFIYTYPKKLIDYNWSTGANTSTIRIDKPGRIHLFGNIDGCAKQDFELIITNDSVPTLFLNDTSICQNDKYYFKTQYPGFIIENKSPPVPSFVVNKNTPISLSLRKNGCIATDNALVSMIPAPTILVDSAACFTLEKTFITLDAQASKSYHWFNQSNNTQYLKAFNYKKYTVQRVNQNNCKDSIVFSVIENCPVSIFIPNAFSPNANSTNDIFKPIIAGVYESYEMIIFNRWGQVIYNSKNQGEWDGKYKNKPVTDGVYAVYIKVITKERNFTYRNTLTVIR